jgi:AraC-like DNA-binding protein
LNRVSLSCDNLTVAWLAWGAKLDVRDEPIALRLSSRSLAGPDSDEAFHELYGRRILKVEIEPLQDEPIDVDISLRTLPGLAIATAETSPILCRHTAMMIDNDDPVIVFNYSGSATYRQNGHETHIGPGEAILTTNGLVGTALCHVARRQVNCRISRALIAPLVKDFDDAIGKPINNPVLPYLLSYLKLVNGNQPLSYPGVQRTVVTHILDLAALLLGARSDAAEIARERGVPAARMQRLKDYIVAEAGDPGLTLTTVAEKHGISTSYVRKLFEAEGTNFTEFVLNQRLARAYLMLTDPGSFDRPITDIAHAAGFNDLSYFYRTFRRVYGAVPSDIRARS